MTLPYINVPERLPLGPLPIHPFGMLVATGIIVGNIIARRRAKALGIDEHKFESLVFWTVGTGIVLSHVLDAIFYHPDIVARDPLEIFRIWNGLSSFGGFFGAALGFMVYCRRANLDPLRCADAIALGLPTGWLFGRMGCSSVHDHPGRASNSFFAVRAGPHWPDGPHFDLGLLELMYTPVIMLAVYLVAKNTVKRGAVVATMCLVYAPVRFGLDFLRVGPDQGGDPRYGGLTPGQWSCFALIVIAAYLYSRADRPLPANAPLAKSAVEVAVKHEQATP